MKGTIGRALALAATLLLFVVGLGAQTASDGTHAVDPADTAELVFVNQLENQMGFDFYEGFVISLDGFPDPLGIEPKGRFVRIMLPPGTYHLNGIGFWSLDQKKFLGFYGRPVQADIVLTAGQATIFPYILSSKLTNLGKGSYRPEIQPNLADAKTQASLRAEYTAAVKNGSAGVLPPRSAATLFLSAAGIGMPVEAALDQDSTPFADFVAAQHFGYPETYQADDGQAFFPRIVSVDSARQTVQVGGYLPRTGSVSVSWGDGSGQAFNGHYASDKLTHAFAGSASVVRVKITWRPLKGDSMIRDFFVRFDGAQPARSDRVEKKLADGTRIVIEDSLVQVIASHPWDDFGKLRFGKQTMVSAVQSLFNDSFDFLYAAPVHMLESGPSGEATKVLNDTEGVGLSLFSNPVTARLRSVIELISRDSYIEGWSLMSHELMHSWGNYVIDTEDGGHWGNSTAAGKLGGIEPDTLTEIAPGKYRAHALDTFHDWWLPFGSLELYLMGLAPASEVPPVRVFKGVKVVEQVRNYTPGDYVIFTASATQTVTIDDIIKKNGPRKPAYGAAPSHFRALAVVVTDRELSPLETAPIGESLAAFADPTPATYGAGNDILYNFAASTRGRGSIQFDGLLQELRPEVDPASLVSPGDSAELVFVNQLDNQMSFDFYEAFSVAFDELPKPLLVMPAGRFVRVMLPPGTYHVKGLGSWLMDRKQPGHGSWKTSVELTLQAGQVQFFPYLLRSALVNLGGGSYRPEFGPVAASAADIAKLRAEYDAAVKAGSVDVVGPRSASGMLQPTSP